MTNTRTPWIDENHPDEKGWTYSYTVRPMDRTHHPGKCDYTYHSPDGQSFSSNKKARAYMGGEGVKRVYNGGKHIRWFYYRSGV